jgi:hypothetical protein
LEEVFMTLSYAAIANNDKIWLILQNNEEQFTYFIPKKW